jgi:hypothetical protein
MSSHQHGESDSSPPLVSTSEGNDSSDSKPSADSATDTSKRATESATDSNSSGNEEPGEESRRVSFPVARSKKEQDDSDSSPPSDDSPSSGNPDSEDKQSTESGTGSDSGSNNQELTPQRIQPSRTENGASPTFPVKLHLILSTKEFEKIVAWLPHGRAWRILDHKALEEKVIPLYFRHGRYSSFARQVRRTFLLVHKTVQDATRHLTITRITFSTTD